MLRDIEKEVLENGTYIRFCLGLEEDVNTKKQAVLPVFVRNISCFLQQNTLSMTGLSN